MANVVEVLNDNGLGCF